MLSTSHVLSLYAAVTNALINQFILCRRGVHRHLNVEVATIVILTILPNALVDILFWYT